MTITKPTVTRLRRIAAKAIAPRGRFDDELYRVWLAGEFGVTSTLDLTEEQGRRAIQILIHGPKNSLRYPPAGDALSLTSRQAYRIQSEEDRLGWTPNPRRLLGYAKRTLKMPISSISAITKSQATRLISALAKMTPDE